MSNDNILEMEVGFDGGVAPGDSLVGQNHRITTVPRNSNNNNVNNIHQQHGPSSSVSEPFERLPPPTNLQYALSAPDPVSNRMSSSSAPGAYYQPTRATGSLPAWYRRPAAATSTPGRSSHQRRRSRRLSRRISAHLAAPFRQGSSSNRRGSSSAFGFLSSSSFRRQQNQIPPEFRITSTANTNTNTNTRNASSSQVSPQQQTEAIEGQEEDPVSAECATAQLPPPQDYKDLDLEEGDARIGIAIIICVSLGIISIILGIYFGVIANPDHQEGLSSSNSNGNNDEMKPPTVSPPGGSSFDDNSNNINNATSSDNTNNNGPLTRFEKLKLHVMEYSSNNDNNNNVFNDRSTPQYMALDWLTNHDTIEIDFVPPTTKDDDDDDNENDIVDINNAIIVERIKTRYALATFYFATFGPEWIDQMQFLSTNQHECNWTTTTTSSSTTALTTTSTNNGVICNENNQITELNIVGWNNLHGVLPKEVMALATTIETIRITNQTTRIGSNLPALRNPIVFTALSNLKLLDLSNNYLDSTIPWEMRHLSNLQELRLGRNSFFGSIPEGGLEDLSHLRILHLQNNKLEHDFSNAIGSLSSLEEFRVDGNRDLLFHFEDSGLWQLTNLQLLNLANVRVQDEIPPEVFTNLSNLQVLNLDRCSIEMPFPNEYIGYLTSLQSLVLDSNYFTGSIQISSSLANIPNLNVLSLRTNEITGSGIPNDIYMLSNLIRLDLSTNDLSGTISSTIGQLSSLEVLSLRSDDLIGSLPSEIGNLSNLQTLDLSFNQLDGIVPTEIGNLTNLESLDLSYNNFNGDIDFLVCTVDGDDTLLSLNTIAIQGNQNLNCACCPET